MIKINWNLIIGFWSGIAVLTLISIARTALHQTLYQYDWYIFSSFNNCANRSIDFEDPFKKTLIFHYPNFDSTFRQAIGL